MDLFAINLVYEVNDLARSRARSPARYYRTYRYIQFVSSTAARPRRLDPRTGPRNRVKLRDAKRADSTDSIDDADIDISVSIASSA